MGSVVAGQTHARSEQAPGFLRSVTCSGRAHRDLHGTNGAGKKKVFSLLFREDDKPKPENEPCITQIRVGKKSYKMSSFIANT